jgi:hypothetical protein
VFDHALSVDPTMRQRSAGSVNLGERADDHATAVAHYQRALERDRLDWELPRLIGAIWR